MALPEGAGSRLDWNDVRYFLAVARGQTLARAASALEVDQTTVGRRLSALEGRLGLALFRRTASGFFLTRAGNRVLEAAERMEEAALELSSGLAAESGVVGTVRVATTDSIAEAFVVPAVRMLRARHPELTVTVSTGWSRVDLRRGEADLAVRLARPADSRLASRKVGEFARRLYASAEYVAERGQPSSLEGHALIAYEETMRFGKPHPFLQLSMRGARLALSSNSLQVLLAAATSGLGIVQLPSFIGDVAPRLVRVFPELEERYPVWLVVPQANRKLAGVRAVADEIARQFTAGASASSSPASPRARRRPQR